jgi:hypothetical protein
MIPVLVKIRDRERDLLGQLFRGTLVGHSLSGIGISEMTGANGYFLQSRSHEAAFEDPLLTIFCDRGQIYF